VPFLRGRAQRLGDDAEGPRLDGRFARLRAEEAAGNSQEVTEVNVAQKHLEWFYADAFPLEIGLDTAGAILEV
jgi:hypothetical protein